MIADICARGERTPSRPELAKMAGVTVPHAEKAVARLQREGVLERIDGGTRRVCWRWLPTGERSRPRDQDHALAVVRDIVARACAAGDETPTVRQLEQEAGLSSTQRAFDKLRQLEDLGLLQRVGANPLTRWVWLPTGQATIPRPKDGHVLKVPIPPPPTKDERRAGRAALKRSGGYEDDPRACLREPPWRPPPIEAHAIGASAAAACVSGWGR